jgi:imidazolonepropionase
MKKVDILIKNASELVTLQGKSNPRTKDEMRQLSIQKNGSIAITDGIIVEIGKTISCNASVVIDAQGKTVMPGFVDAHTHLVFAGSREFEVDMKLHGLSYMDILQRGGGIFYSVEQTRNTSKDILFSESIKRLDRMLSYGTTTCEAKSGYGLDTATELKILQVQQQLNKNHCVDIVSTFLGAHAVPQGFTSDEYTKLLIDEMLPKMKGYAEFCDVFCEQGVFTPQQSKMVLDAAKQYGMTPKIHADEIIDTGGAQLAADVKAISADHLLRSNTSGLKAMADASIIGVLLPGTPFCLMMNEYANARLMISQGVAVALATDLNPNCYTENMQLMIQLACFNMKMTPAEAVTAASFNAACAIGRQDRIGSLEVGKQADVLILDCPSHLFLGYHFGVNLVDTVIKKGKVVVETV